jgi:hypothetical protein
VSRIALCFVLLVATSAAAERSTAVRIDGKESASDKAARSLMVAMRAVAAKERKRAKPSGDDTDTAVAKADCLITHPACAASVGSALAVTHMLVGQVERRGSRYTLTLSLVNVETKQRVRSLRESIAVKANLAKWARALYTRILDEGTGEIVIISNAKRGQVLLDGLAVTELYEGRATIAGVALGTHQVEIRAPGYKPFATEIAVDGRTEESLLLDPAP